MLPVGFEPMIPAGERPQNHALETARPLGPAIVDIIAWKMYSPRSSYEIT
jgi:hypothetical protein